MKRIALCLDGTWNSPTSEKQKEDGSTVYRPTNVLKTARAIKKRAEDDTLQITYYDPGVGAMSEHGGAKTVQKLDNWIGGGWGAGFEHNIEEAYGFLARNYEEGDELYIFGFSRGASQARSLCSLLNWAGGLPQKGDVYYCPRLFDRYIEERGHGNADSMIEEINRRARQRDRRELHPFIQPKIKYLGIYDTVLALGSRRKAKKSSAAKYGFHTPPILPSNVESCRHALAIDEKRHDFQPEVLSGDERVQQEWFPGVHSDIGGSRENDSLANAALDWIVGGATKLEMDADYLEFFVRRADGPQGKKSKFYKAIDFGLWMFRGRNGKRKLDTFGNIPLHESTIQRLNSDPNESRFMKDWYRPDNLIEYLANHSNYDNQLPADTLKKVLKERA